MMNKKQTASIVLLLLACIGLLIGFFSVAGKKGQDGSLFSVFTGDADGEDNGSNGDTDEGDSSNRDQGQDTDGLNGAEENIISLIHAEGNTLETRVAVPEGYQRVKAKKKSLASFLRDYPLKKDGSPVRCYNGKKKSNQYAHVAVFRLPIEEEDLQQCADSIMRVYAEYYWKTRQYDKIAFHFVDGFLAEYSKWRQGYRIQVGSDKSSYVKSADADTSYEAFQSYLRIVFSYASTLSMEAESQKINLSAIQTGDILIRGGSPGHVVMVVDVCKNQDGKKAFLLAQGFMPAQEFHLLKNPLHEEDPWYYQEEVTWPLCTPEYTFDKGDLMRPMY